MSAPGPIYDNALRYLAASELAPLCGWLGIAPLGENIRVSEALAAVTRYADLLISTGPRPGPRRIRPTRHPRPAPSHARLASADR
ncbi:MAG: hypothetical protein IPK24_22725 [Kineosporiaceae bacterium]|nr:hypothetical protein [Kineosporiaceae bacterium]